MVETTDDASGEPEAEPSRPGWRSAERGRPRVGTTAAAAGAFVVFSGAMLLAFDTSSVEEGGGGSTTPGTLISLAVVIGGYVLLAVQRHGPMATAGVVAFAIALPFFVGFATFSEGEFPPLSFDAILGLSAVGWAAAYAVGPSRRHPFLLGGALLAGWWFLLEQVTGLFTSPFTLLELFFLSALAPSDPIFDAGTLDPPDPTEIAVVCGLVAVLYLGVSYVLERRGADGMATPMVAVGHVAAIVAIFTITDDLEEIGTGILAVIAGCLLMYRGATAGRRATTWLGGVYLAGGLQAIVSGITDSPTSGGVLLIGAGSIVVVLAAYFASSAHEPDDDDPGPSFPDGFRRRTPALVTSAVDEAEAERPPTAEGPTAPGWWRASDGNWYPPDQHPDVRRG